MDLDALVRSIEGFDGWSPTDKIRLFAWYLHRHEKKDRWVPVDIRECFDRLGSAVPPNAGQLITNLLEAKPAQVLRDNRGLRLERAVLDRLDAKHGQRAITIQVHQTLHALPDKVPDLAERIYLEEALKCIKSAAYRASMIMTWNLVYDHLCMHILTKRRDDFNAAAKTEFPRGNVGPVTTREDFHEILESNVLRVCRAASITTKNVHGVLEEKLKARNRVAHAGGQVVEQPMAESYILDIVNNALVQLK